VATIIAIPLALASPATALAQEKEASKIGTSDPQSIENLDPALLAEMRRQAVLEPAVHALYREHVASPGSGWAGIAFEGDGLTLYYEGPLTSKMTAALNQARRYGPVNVVAAAHSLAELEREALKIHEVVDLRGGSDIQAVELAHDGSGLVVERVPAGTAAELAAKRAARGEAPLVAAAEVVRDARLAVPVKITTASAPITAMAARRDDFAPWNGGGRWESWRNGASRMACTTGFGVTSGGTTYVLTAAHCATAPDYGRQGYQSTLEYMGPVIRENYSYDLILINARGSGLIFDGSNTTSTTKSVLSWGYWAANQLVCQSGATSGTICGLRQHNSADIIINCCDSDGDSGYRLYGLIRTTQVDGGTAGRGGDSGGPVFTLDGSGVRAKGIVSAGSGNTMYFQDWADVERLYSAYPV
jgi:hypothetical protein